MLPALDQIQRQLNRTFGIEWIPVSPLKSKPERIMSLQPLLLQDKLYFSSGINPEVMVELLKQFKRFPRYIHDDIPDSISMLLGYRGRIDIAPQDTNEGEEQLTSVLWSTDEDNLLGAGLVG